MSRASPTPVRGKAVGAVLTLLLATGLAHAAPTLSASASNTLDPPGHTETNTGPVAEATYAHSQAGGSATGTAKPRQVNVDVQAGSSTFVSKYAAQAISSTPYELWSLTEQRALTFDEAQGLTLRFDFRLLGGSSVNGGAHERDVTYTATLRALLGTWSTQDSLRGYRVCGVGCLELGDPTLLDAVVDRSFSLLHADDNTGVMGLDINALGSINAELDYQLSLEAIALLPTLTPPQFSAFSVPSAQADAGWTLDDGLGVRFADGQLLTVVGATVGAPLPEPGALALLLAAALAAAGAHRRTRGSVKPSVGVAA